MFTVSELIAATGGVIVHSGSCANVRTISTDSRAILERDAFLAIPGEKYDGHDFIPQVLKKGVRCVIIEQGRRIARPDGATVIEVPDTVAALGDIAHFHRKRFTIPVIAVTGSNGKTTTKEMLSWILSAKFPVLKNEGTQNNHIGVPATLLRLDASHECAVIEMGTNHPGEIAYLSRICEPTMGIITNIGPSHLEYFKDLRGVYKEKISMFEALRSPSIAVMNADDPLLRRKLVSRRTRPLCVGFGIRCGCDFQARDVRRGLSGYSFVMPRARTIRLSTPGECNIYNALAAIAAGRMLGLEYEMIAAQFRKFVFPKGRLTVRTVDNVCFIDDSYNANPLSLAQAMAALRQSRTAGRRVLVMGDMLELGNGTERFHEDAGRLAAESCDIFVTVGKHTRAAAAAAVSKGFDKTNVFLCDTPAQARDILFHTISVGRDDVILLKGSRGMRLEKILETAQPSR